MVMRKSAPTRRRATRTATKKKATKKASKKTTRKSARTSVKSALRTAGRRTAGKKKTALRSQPATRGPALPRPDVLGATRAMGAEPSLAAAPARAAAVPGACLSLDDAAAIVLQAAGNPSGGLDLTLEDARLITTLLRQRFQQRVLDAVRGRGCALDLDEIPNDADTTLGEVADAVQAQAR